MKGWKSPIPRNIHVIWFGTQEYPDYFKLFLKTFEQHLPEFNI